MIRDLLPAILADVERDERVVADVEHPAEDADRDAERGRPTATAAAAARGRASSGAVAREIETTPTRARRRARSAPSCLCAAADAASDDDDAAADDDDGDRATRFLAEASEASRDVARLRDALRALRATHEESQCVASRARMDELRERLASSVVASSEAAAATKARVERVARGGDAFRDVVVAVAAAGRSNGDPLSVLSDIDRRRVETVSRGLRKSFASALNEYNALRVEIARERGRTIRDRVYAVTGAEMRCVLSYTGPHTTALAW